MTRTRYRCTSCGNLTRFDVTETRTTRAFHHYTVGGDLSIEEEEVLAAERTGVVCRWCGAGLGVVVVEPVEAGEDGPSPAVGDDFGVPDPGVERVG